MWEPILSAIKIIQPIATMVTPTFPCFLWIPWQIKFFTSLRFYNTGPIVAITLFQTLR